MTRLRDHGAAEYELVKAHAALGAQMAREALTDEQALWIEQHHERFDGTGYPKGLAGAKISEGAGLRALADSWDVMTTVRSYSPAKHLLGSLLGGQLGCCTIRM